MDNRSTQRDRSDARGVPIGEPGRDDPYSGTARPNVYGPDMSRQTNPDESDNRSDARDRSVGSLLKELRDELTTLFRQEMALAKTELSEKASKTGRDLGSIATGAALLMCGLLVVLLGLSALLYWVMVRLDASHYHAGWIAPLIVGAVTAFIGWGLVQSGRSRIRDRSPVPEKTIQSIKEDKQWLADQTTK